LNGWVIPFFGAEQVPYTIIWSLSVEETAYALLGLSTLWGVRGIRLALFGLLSGTVAFRVLVVLTGIVDLYDLYFFVPARLDGIALGGLAVLGSLGRFERLQPLLYVGAPATLSLIWTFQFVRVQNPFVSLIGYLVFALACSLWVLLIAQRASSLKAYPIGRSLTIPLISFGQLSYFVYLFHLFMLEGLRLLQAKAWIPPLSFWSAVMMTCLFTHGLAWLSWRFFESPFIEQGKKFAIIIRQRRSS
jgi:peptidoglycan/LPS O-acetylase OafA/YrhL